MAVRCAVAPRGPEPGLAEAIAAAGGEVVGVEEAEVLVWTDPLDADGLGRLP